MRYRLLFFCFLTCSLCAFGGPKAKQHLPGFPLLETPSVFVGNIDDVRFALFIEKSEPDGIEGHYMRLEGPVSDTLPFRMILEGNEAHAYYRSEEETYLTRDFQFDTLLTLQETPLSHFAGAGFYFERLEPTPFERYESRRYVDSLFTVTTIPNIQYGKAEGYWTEMRDNVNVIDKILKMQDVGRERPLTLNLDLYLPENDPVAKRPLVMLLHGGSFYFGTKDDKAITKWCQHLTSLGYVTASVNYRMGFNLNVASIERAGYRALQDAHAAMRYLVAHQEEYGIDTSLLFIGGTSAGSIISLNLAFMTNETRPESSYDNDRLSFTDLGDIEDSGNNLKTDFHLKGVVDMWGGISDIEMLKGHKEPILAFHGDADDVVPYDYGYPFEAAGVFNRLLVNKMYGSSCIEEYAIGQGQQVRLFTFDGYKHSPHVDPRTKEFNNNFYFIQREMSSFFHELVNNETAEIIEDNGYYTLDPQPLKSCWKVEGGLIRETEGQGVHVVWMGNAPQHTLTVSALLSQGIDVYETHTITIHH